MELELEFDAFGRSKGDGDAFMWVNGDVVVVAFTGTEDSCCWCCICCDEGIADICDHETAEITLGCVNAIDDEDAGSGAVDVLGLPPDAFVVDELLSLLGKKEEN